MFNLKSILAALALVTIAPVASAANYAVFLHGRSEAVWNGGKTVPAGYAFVDAATDWNGTASISNIQYARYASLCKAPNKCVVYNYSTGGLITQRMQLLDGAANPVYINSFASAGGGSGLADACGWVTQWGCYYGGVDDNLKPSWARNGGNALQYTRGASSWHVAGNGLSWLGAATAAVVDGDDDGATGPDSNTGCDRRANYYLPTDCKTTRGTFWDGNSGGVRKSGHKQWVTGGWTHFNITPTQSTYWY
jgi:hypothetical protein